MNPQQIGKEVAYYRSPSSKFIKEKPGGEAFMTFDQFTEAMSKSIFLPNEEQQKEEINVFDMGDEDLEEEEC